MGKHKKIINAIVSKFEQLGVKRAAPAIAQTEEQFFLKVYKNDFTLIKTGQTIKI